MVVVCGATDRKPHFGSRRWSVGTTIHQLRQELDDSFRNEMEKIRNNELASLAGLLKEMERGDNKQLTASIPKHPASHPSMSWGRGPG
jgi:hypothetical protein